MGNGYLLTKMARESMICLASFTRMAGSPTLGMT